MRSDGRRAIRITNSGQSNGDPSWSADGTIVFTRSVDECDGLYRIAADGSRVRPLNDPSGDESAFDADVSQDGSRIVYVDADCEIRLDCCYLSVVDNTGEGTGDLGSLAVDDAAFNPAWSPDGERLAFVSGDFQFPSIFIVNRDGSEMKRLTGGYEEGAAAHSPSWSPDGREIVFTRYLEHSQATDLYIVQVDGTGLRQLTKTRGDEGAPTWVPALQSQ